MAGRSRRLPADRDHPLPGPDARFLEGRHGRLPRSPDSPLNPGSPPGRAPHFPPGRSPGRSPAGARAASRLGRIPTVAGSRRRWSAPGDAGSGVGGSHPLHRTPGGLGRRRRHRPHQRLVTRSGRRHRGRRPALDPSWERRPLVAPPAPQLHLGATVQRPTRLQRHRRRSSPPRLGSQVHPAMQGSEAHHPHQRRHYPGRTAPRHLHGGGRRGGGGRQRPDLPGRDALPGRRR